MGYLKNVSVPCKSSLADCMEVHTVLAVEGTPNIGGALVDDRIVRGPGPCPLQWCYVDFAWQRLP